MFNPIFKENPGAETSRELCICRTRTTYVTKALSEDQKVINGHKNLNDSYNYEIEFHVGISDSST